MWKNRWFLLATNAQRKTDNRHYNKPKVNKFSTDMKKQAAKWMSEDKWSLKIISVVGNETENVHSEQSGFTNGYDSANTVINRLTSVIKRFINT